MVQLQLAECLDNDMHKFLGTNGEILGRPFPFNVWLILCPEKKPAGHLLRCKIPPHFHARSIKSLFTLNTSELLSEITKTAAAIAAART